MPSQTVYRPLYREKSVPGDCRAPSHDRMLPGIQHERSAPLNLDYPLIQYVKICTLTPILTPSRDQAAFVNSLPSQPRVVVISRGVVIYQVVTLSWIYI